MLTWTESRRCSMAGGNAFTYEITEWPLTSGPSDYVLCVCRRDNNATRQHTFTTIERAKERAEEYERNGHA